MVDRYTQTVLTVIALSLATIALRGGDGLVPSAHAADTQSVRIERAIEIGRLPEPIQVEIKQAFSQPGTSSSSPVYVKLVE